MRGRDRRLCRGGWRSFAGPRGGRERSRSDDGRSRRQRHAGSVLRDTLGTGCRGCMSCSIDALRNKSARILDRPGGSRPSATLAALHAHRCRRRSGPRSETSGSDAPCRRPVPSVTVSSLEFSPPLLRAMQRRCLPSCAEGWQPCDALSGGWGRSSVCRVRAPARPVPSGSGRRRRTGSCGSSDCRASLVGRRPRAHPSSATRCG